MAELSITRQDNRVTVVGDVRTTADRDCLMAVAEGAIGDTTAGPGDLEIVLDVAQAGYFDSRALFTLVGIARRCVGLGGSLTLEGAGEELQEQLHMTGIDQILGAHGTRMAPTDRSDSTGVTA